MRAKRLLMVSLVLAAACKPPTPAEEMDSVLSWIGTAGMAGDAWLRHSTPDTYTRQTLERSGESLQQISKDLLESPPPAVDSAALDGVLTRTRDRITRMAGLIKAKDAPDFARQLDSLRADQKVIKTLVDSIESKQ
jgi:hypothetical protein